MLEFVTQLGLIALSLSAPEPAVTRLWLSLEPQAAVRLDPLASLTLPRHFLHAPHYHTDSSSGPAYLAGRESAVLVDEMRLTYRLPSHFPGARSA